MERSRCLADRGDRPVVGAGVPAVAAAGDLRPDHRPAGALRPHPSARFSSRRSTFCQAPVASVRDTVKT